MNSITRSSTPLFLFLSICCCIASADTWYVSTEGSNYNSGTSWDAAFATIQRGIDAASDGDEVIVADGRYRGNGNWNITFDGKAITVRSLNGPNSCIIYCAAAIGYSFRAFIFENNETASSQISGFDIVKGRATLGGGIYCENSSPTIHNCYFRFCLADTGGGIYCLNAAPIIDDCNINNGYATSGEGHGIYVDNSAITIRGGQFSDGIFTRNSSSLEIINATLSGNSRGPAIQAIDSTLQIINSQICGNDSDGLTLQHGIASIINSTIADNALINTGTGIRISGNATVTIDNSIIWGNDSVGGLQLSIDSAADVNATFSCIQGALEGTGNINSPPHFAHTTEWAYTLLPGSPCIDTGDLAALPPDSDDLDGDGNITEPIPIDAAGHERIVGSAPDMGAFEFISENDCNGNGIPDNEDVANCENSMFCNDCDNDSVIDICAISLGIVEDCTGNRVPDVCDLQSGTEPDINSNGIPDVCETDCNQNQIPDTTDISSGYSLDCNNNNTPDECDIASLESSDCNSNIVPDECEPDCNNNTIADECDISSGQSEDCNSNIVPDECEPDCNNNGIADECDIADGQEEDCNHNSIPDSCDLNSGHSDDCNTNQMPDECEIAINPELDLNINGILDSCEPDCNQNGIPDDLDISSGLESDVDENGVPDSCQYIYVDANALPGGDGDSWETAFDTIQAAVGAADDGDIVLLGDGTYVGPGNYDIFISKAISIIGLNGPTHCIIDCQASMEEPRRTFFFRASTANPPNLIQGITFSNGFAGDDEEGKRSGGAIFAINDLSVKDCVFTGNRVYGGSGCAICALGDILIDNCLFSNNFILTDKSDSIYWGDGGALQISSSNTNSRITNCVFRNNTASQGGAVSIRGPGILICQNCVFMYNQSRSSGGAISINDSSFKAINCHFLANQASTSGGVLHVLNTEDHKKTDRNSITFSDCTIANNQALYIGGAICNQDSSSITIENTLAWGNVSRESGAQIYNSGTGQIQITSSIIEGYWEHDPAWFLQPGHTSIVWGPGNSGSQPRCSRAGYLTANSSACRDAGLTSLLPVDTHDLDDDGDTTESLPIDIHGEIRVHNFALDIGADEFLDANSNSLPDAWERKYFPPVSGDGCETVVMPDEDPDQDGLTNLDEFELYGSNPSAPPIHVDAMNAGDPNSDGSSTSPFGTIQEALDAAGHGDTILIASGIYSGPGNEEIDTRGNSVVLFGAPGTIVSNLMFENGPNDSSLIGLTFQPATGQDNSELRYRQSRLLLKDCYLDSTTLKAFPSSLWLDNILLDLTANSFLDHCHVRLIGDVTLASGTLNISSSSIYSNNMTEPDPTILLRDDATLAFTGETGDEKPSTIYANIIGTGTIYIAPGQALRVRGGSTIDLQDRAGTMLIEGLLSMEDASTLQGASVSVFEMTLGDSGVVHNDINLVEASAGYGGEIFVTGQATVENNTIRSEGDRYLDLDPDPETFPRPNIQNNLFYVQILQGTQGDQGTLLELRTEDYDTNTVGSNGESGAYLLPASEGYADTWVLEELEILDNAKVTLTNRQGFTFIDSDYPEALYVKTVILHPGAVLNTGLQRMYYQQLIDEMGNPIDPTMPHPNCSRIVDEPLLGFSLAIIALDDDLTTDLTNEAQVEFDVRIRKRLRNPLDTESCECMGTCSGDKTRSEPDPTACRLGSISLVPESEVQSVLPSWDGDNTTDNGVLELKTMADDRTETSSIAAKGAFAAAGKEEVTIFFDYLWQSQEPDDELIVYISNSPVVSTCASSNGFSSCHYELGRMTPTGEPGTPGLPGSDQFGTFVATFPADILNFTRGVYVELELRSSLDDVPASIWINDWDPQILCAGTCADLNGNYTLDSVDYLLLVASYGEAVDISSEHWCLNNGMSNYDGYVDIFDLAGWDTLLANPNSDILNVCENPMASPGMKGSSANRHAYTQSLSNRIVLSGKSAETATQEDYLFAYGPNALVTTNGVTILNPEATIKQYSPRSIPDESRSRGFGQVITDATNTVYQLHGEFGMLRCMDGVAVLPPRVLPSPIGIGDTVCVGLVGETGQATYGTPLLDITFHPTDPAIVYVTPVVVVPTDGHCPYRASAKLHLTDPDQGLYEVLMVYGDNPDLPPHPEYGCGYDLQDAFEAFQNPREIAVDGAGTVYVLNASSLNAMVYDRLILFDDWTGELVQILDRDDGVPPSPSCLLVSTNTNQLWLTSALTSPPVPAGPVSTELVRFSLERGKPYESITFAGTQKVKLPTANLPDIGDGFTGSITTLSLTDSGDILAAGFTMPKYPENATFTSDDHLFTKAVLARIPVDTTGPVMAAMVNSGPALPLSILQVPRGNPDGDQNCDGDVDLEDFAGFQQCFGSDSSECLEVFDLDENNVIDASDFTLFENLLDGPE